MKLLSAVRSVAAWALLSVLIAATGLGQSLMESGPLVSGASTPTQRQFKYLGSYCSDGKFRARSRLDRLLPHRTLSPASGPANPEATRPSEVPPFVQLGSREWVVEDLHGHSVAATRERSVLAEGRDAVLTLVYGHQKVLRAPRHLTTDSNQRLIISDPALPALHVLDTKGRRSFRIVGGPGHRLHLPSGVAVDSENSIYVADSEQGMVFVYLPDGVFLRSIGDLGGGETLFHYPTSIAIDSRAGRLYVLDGSRLLMLDLQGKILKRTGKLRGDTRPFSNPTDLVLSDQELLVLDASGSRVQIMDLQCNLLRTLSLSDVPMSHDNAVGMDHEGNIYVSFADASVIRGYSHEGALLSSFGHAGIRIGEFNYPTGLWIDSTNRIYVADTGNVRVQVFQSLARSTSKLEGAIGSH